jgi:Ca2+-binding RTX toxin-like protein
MLALFILPALLGLALVVNLTDDDDDHDEAQLPPEPEPPIENPTNPAPTCQVFAPPPAPDTFDTALNVPAPQPTSAGITLEDDRTPVRLSGTGGDDIINATDEATSIRGNAGNDLLFGGDNDENISGEDGRDTIVAGGGDDTFSGGRGNDLIYLGDGDDRSAGFDGQDRGNDTVYGGAGDDVLRDDAGSNLTFGGIGNDTISSVNTFTGAELNGADTLIGGAGDDFLSGDAGDLMYGGIGEDQFNVWDNGAAATIIADFNVNDDVLMIVVPSTGSAEPLEFTHNAAQNGVAVTIGDDIVAFLHGVTANQIATLRTEASVTVFDRLAVSG